MDKVYDHFLTVLNCQRKFWPKTWTKFDGVELHPTFLQSFISFDGNQPIRIQFRIYIICFKTKAHVQKSRESTRSWLDGQGWQPEKRVQGKGWEWKRKGDDFLVFVSKLQNTVHIQKNKVLPFFLGWLDPSFIDVYMKFPPKNKPLTKKTLPKFSLTKYLIVSMGLLGNCDLYR